MHGIKLFLPLDFSSAKVCQTLPPPPLRFIISLLCSCSVRQELDSGVNSIAHPSYCKICTPQCAGGHRGTCKGTCVEVRSVHFRQTSSKTSQQIQKVRRIASSAPLIISYHQHESIRTSFEKVLPLVSL